MPPMPPPPGIAGALSFLGASEIMASVVTSKPATDAAFWSAARTTLAGRLQHVYVLLGLRVEAEGLGLVVGDPAHHDRALDARVLGDLPDRSLKRFQDDVDAGLDVIVLTLKRLSRCFGPEHRNAAAWTDTFLDCRTGGVKSILDAVLLLLHLDLGRTADADDRHAARELRQALLELLTVVVGGGLLDLRLDLGDAALDVRLLARAIDDRGILLLDAHALSAPEHVERHVLELDAEVLGDCLAGGEH